VFVHKRWLPQAIGIVWSICLSPSVITVHNNNINNTELLQKVPENWGFSSGWFSQKVQFRFYNLSSTGSQHCRQTYFRRHFRRSNN